MPSIPPPPVLPPTALISTTNRQYLKTTFPAKLDIQECLWAKDDPEVQKACIFIHLSYHLDPRNYGIFP